MVSKQRRPWLTGRGANVIAGDTQAFVETLDMLEVTEVLYSTFLHPWQSLSDVESILRNNKKVM